MNKIIVLVLLLAGCVAAPEIRACEDACGFRGLKKVTMLSCQCHPNFAPCK